MQHTTVERQAIQLAGICVRTSYQQELDLMRGRIGPCVMRYFHEALFEKIPHRIAPGTTFCVYTDYESDYKGAYTYFIGEEVDSLDSQLPEGFHRLTIPGQHYAKFTTKPAPMPDVVVNAWKAIWEMSPKELGGIRNYQADFEIYDERAADHQNIVFDLYVGIKL
jgi:predicted transcriptional regulator YdeE